MWEEMARKIVEAVRTGDLAVTSIGLTNAEKLKYYREIKKERYSYGIVFFLLERILAHCGNELERGMAYVEQYAPDRKAGFIEEELSKLPEEVRYCIEMALLFRKIRGEDFPKVFGGPSREIQQTTKTSS